MFTLIDLPYPKDALEPVISARTLEFHHGKHLQAYIDNLNKFIPNSGLEDLPIEEIVVKAFSSLPAPAINLTAIFNNAGQILNHNMYFTQFKTPPVIMSEAKTQAKREMPTDKVANLPYSGKLLTQIEKQWGNFDIFKAEFEAKGVSLFGSGWVWLSAKDDGTLVITQEHDAGNPVTRGLQPILTFDVWEHAYYLDYQNRRATHLSALWRIVDWDVIEKRYSM
jgi:Fe-Mn family superoxide dismutase